ncbi:MAG: hypothetical protein AAF743_15900 [Planctomycetota bacterium]
MFTTRESRVSVARRMSGVVCAVACLLIVVSGCRATPGSAATKASTVESVHSAETFDLLRNAADHEALFTLAGGLKPMSSGIWQGSFAVDEPDLSELSRVRTALTPLRNDTWYADVQVFEKVHEGERFADAYIVHRVALARMIERLEPFWRQWGITPQTHPAEVVAVVERMPRGDRWRGYGYLFGYPDAAVDFFVKAGLETDDDEIGPGQDRKFVQIPTFAAAAGRFTYAVPFDHVPTVADDVLAAEAQRILAVYTERRDTLQDVPTMMEELAQMNERFESQAAAVHVQLSHEEVQR